MNRLRHYSRNQVEKAAKQKPSIDAAKWIALALSVLGIQAWIAGAAFEWGYWGAAGLEGPLAFRSAQHTALMGFLGAFRVWTGAAAWIAIVGIFIIVTAISFRKAGKADRKRKRTRIEEWAIATFSFDKQIGTLGVTLAILGAIFFALLVVPLAFWTVAAHGEGVVSFTKQACAMRKGEGKNTHVKLANGSSVDGRLIDRSEKMLAILVADSIQVLTTGERPELLYTIQLNRIQCPVGSV